MTTNTTSNGQHQKTTEKEEIWSTILSTVASSKMVPIKRMLVLGDSASGKSTLIHYLKNDPGPQVIKAENDSVPTFGVNNNYVSLPVDNLDDDTTSTLALGYNVIDFQDEENEAIARLGVYQLGLSATEYLPLLKFALSTDTLNDSCAIIILDWTRPWLFVESLQRWMNALQHRINEIRKEGSAGESWSKGKAMVDELKEKIENYLQTYTEPVVTNPINMTESTSTESEPPAPANSTNPTVTPAPLVSTTHLTEKVLLPLSQGTLTENIGIPIIIVCCKSDAIDTLDQTADYSDEHFDFIQQMLRCVCMKYGAALFYTSTRQTYTFHNLRQYILHRLLTTATRSYPFNTKAQVIERDVVFVPSGWDSWGKIRILREGFDCEANSQGWDADMDAVADRQQPGIHGARGSFEEVISDSSSKEQPLHSIPPLVTCEEEQKFLSRHFEAFEKAPDTSNGRKTAAGFKPSILGPAGNSSLDIGTRSDENLKSRDYSDKSKLITSSGLSNGSSGSSFNLAQNDSGFSLPGNIAGQYQEAPSEVLENFFKSLITKKPSSGDISLEARESDSTTSSIQSRSRRPTISRKDIGHKEDRLRQFINKS